MFEGCFWGKQMQSWITTQCLQESVHTEIKSRFSSMTTIQSTAQNHVKVTWRENKTVGKPSPWIAPPITRPQPNWEEAFICSRTSAGNSGMLGRNLCEVCDRLINFKNTITLESCARCKRRLFWREVGTPAKKKTSRAPLILGLS